MITAKDNFSRLLFALTVLALWAIVFRLYLAPQSSGAVVPGNQENAQTFTVTDADANTTVFIRKDNELRVIEKVYTSPGIGEWQVVKTIPIQ